MDFFLGQIGIYGFNFAPRGWAFCNGAIIGIPQNTALYSLIGTTYGGNGVQTFGLPDLRSRTPMCFGPQTSMGEMAGVENVTLLGSEMPAHTHAMGVNNAAATTRDISGAVFAAGTSGTAALPGYVLPGGTVTLNPSTVSMTGGNLPHSNIQPSLAVNYCIATTGIYPSRN